MKIAKNIVTVLLAVLIGLSVPLGIIVFSVRSEIGNTSLLTVKIAEDDYFELVSDRVSETVKRKLALVVITPEQLSEFFTAQALRDDAPSARIMRRILTRTTTSVPRSSVSYSNIPKRTVLSLPTVQLIRCTVCSAMP